MADVLFVHAPLIIVIDIVTIFPIIVALYALVVTNAPAVFKTLFVK